MPRVYRLAGALIVVILVFVLCPEVLDLEPMHWAYGQIGCMAGAVAGHPWILRPGSPMSPIRLTDKMAIFSPRRVRRYPANSSGFSRRLTEETERDYRNGAKIVIDTTRADTARVTKLARSQVRGLAKAGVIRVVIWDGAHHLPSLPLDPDVLVVPVLPDTSGNLWVCHGTMADAVPVGELLWALERFGCNGWVVAVPRLGTLAKADRSLESLTRAVIRKISGSHGIASPKRPVKGRFLAERVFLSGDGTLIWGSTIRQRERALALWNDAVRAGARRVLYSAESINGYEWLKRHCLIKGLTISRFGYPIGVRDIIMSRLLGRHLKKDAGNHRLPGEE